MEPQFYSLWSFGHNNWTHGYRVVNGKVSYQDPLNPWLLTYQECQEWVRNDWGSYALVEIRPLPLTYIQTHASQIDQARRKAHADKYL